MYQGSVQIQHRILKRRKKRITAQTKPYEYMWLYHLVHMFQFSDKDFKMKLPVFKIF